MTMTIGVFKNRYMKGRNKVFDELDVEPFEELETLEETYEIPDVLDYEVKDAIKQVLSTLTPREQMAIKGRFFENLTWGEVGLSLAGLPTNTGLISKYGVGANRAMQITSKALRKIKHPSRSELLRNFI